MPPATLAFIGDAVYTLYIRRRIAEATDFPSGTLHLVASKFVNAKAQARVFDALCESNSLTAEETDVARRAKNAHLHSRAKAATSEDYHKATALEAVLGYLSLSGDEKRVNTLLEACAAFGGLDEYLSRTDPDT